MSNRYMLEDVLEIIKNNGFLYIENSNYKYKNVNSKLLCYDSEGYKILLTVDKLLCNRKNFLKFHKSNPYSIENINHYSKLNNLTSICISDEYVGVKDKLVFLCECGNTFETSWDTYKYSHKNKCDKCTGYTTKLTYNDIRNNLFDNGYELITKEEGYKGITLSDLICKDSEGYKYRIEYNAIMRGVGCHKVHKSNPFSIYNINLFFNKYANGEYECISNKYIDSKTKNLEVIHKKCNKTLFCSWTDINQYRNMYKDVPEILCKYCNSNIESWHAIILKQIFLHEYVDSIVEERSCINPLTNCVLPTDIVNHRLKIAIEVQSEFHDKDSQKQKDEIKKNFWINKGYKFYNPDIRNYTILEMINIFFKNITEIPKYIDYDYSKKLNIDIAQKLLNDGKNPSQISDIMQVNIHRIYDAIYSNKLYYPNNYQNACYKKIVKLDLNGNLLKYYNKVVDVKEDGYNPDTINSAIICKNYYSSGYLWCNKDDYENGNFSVPEFRDKKFLIPVARCDMNGNILQSYNSILDIENKYKRTNYEVYRVIIGKRKSLRGYKYKQIMI